MKDIVQVLISEYLTPDLRGEGSKARAGSTRGARLTGYPRMGNREREVLEKIAYKSTIQAIAGKYDIV